MAKIWNSHEPIIRSLLETDVYKIMMMALIYKWYPFLKVKFEFKNRTKVRVHEYVNAWDVQAELHAVAKMRFSKEEIAYIASWGMHEPGFLKALEGLRLTAPTVEIENGELSIITHGSWFETTLWEIYILAIVSELYSRRRAAKEHLSEDVLWDEMNRRLTDKVTLFNKYPGIKFSQFGLRRRISNVVEDHVTGRLLEECPGMTGVSNVYLAQKLGVEAQGTNAHELPMALVALARHESPKAVREAIYHVLELWQKLYGFKALIMLDDTYGSDRFREYLPRHFAEDFRGFRHDSGDPLRYGEETISYYNKLGIDPREKLIIFSDGLVPEKVVEIHQRFAGRIGVVFGIGTNLTNDVGEIQPLSLVMKLSSAAGNPAVKLSNNLDKATGNRCEIEAIKEIFGYTNTAREAVIY